MHNRCVVFLLTILLTACTAPSVTGNNIHIEEYAILGNPDAPVTLVEYSDYQCPFCRKFTVDVLPKIKASFIETGLVRLVYKDFPLHIHNQAIEAAVATHCAGQQDAYYPFHDILFERAKDISKDNFVSWAQELSLNMNVYETCLSDPIMRDRVMRSIGEAKRHGVVGTPSFLINGQYLAGAQPFAVFEQHIQAALHQDISYPQETEDARCVVDTDCGDTRSFPTYCSRITGNEVCMTTSTPVCSLPGTDVSQCVTMIKEECSPCSPDMVCNEGECVQQ